MLLLSFIACIAACHASLLSISPADFQQAGDIKIASIVHNSPSAISHTTFTRVHNHQHPNNQNYNQHAQSAQMVLADSTIQTAAVHQTSTVAVQPVRTTQKLHAIPVTIIKPNLQTTLQIVDNIDTTAATTIKDETAPIVESLRHTPAHLTFAARPVIYQMLPQIKPVQKISFAEFVPSPRKLMYIH